MPPRPPPHKVDTQYGIACIQSPAPAFQPCIIDKDYLHSSSLETALIAAKNRNERLCSVNQEFPPISAENVHNLRTASQAGPQDRLFFARYLLEATHHLQSSSEDVQRAQHLKQKMEQEAIHTLKRASARKAGCAEAQFFLGNCYGHGLYGLKLDLEKAFGLYLQGSKSNHPESTYRVAVCYELGLGAKRSRKHAVQFYRKAANLGDPSAMYKLGMMSLKSQPKESLSWFLRAAQVADEKNPHALHELGLIHCGEHGFIPSVVPDVDYARELFSQAALLGYAPSQVQLGIAYEHGSLNCPKDAVRSIAWYSRAAEQGDTEAELALSGWFYTGAENVMPSDGMLAYQWARKAADKDFSKAEYAVGFYTELGVGVPQNWAEAKIWYTKAANQGEPKAIQRLHDHSQSLKQRPKRNKSGNIDFKNSDCTIM
ncbi:hypothetical protein BY458DRAFT_522478 [Sporodiniella umbellata]|nr:hypothetical protein BY458DRAFT_522478 [Sporodiniella umbellata]